MDITSTKINVFTSLSGSQRYHAPTEAPSSVIRSGGGGGDNDAVSLSQIWRVPPLHLCCWVKSDRSERFCSSLHQDLTTAEVLRGVGGWGVGGLRSQMEEETSRDQLDLLP